MEKKAVAEDEIDAAVRQRQLRGVPQQVFVGTVLAGFQQHRLGNVDGDDVGESTAQQRDHPACARR